jgi:acetylornithine/N-succinyldiaminopimelate aminotransferase
VSSQAATLMHVSNLYISENQAQLARRLSELALGGKCFFCNSGAEANEGLIKLARLWGSAKEKFEIISMTNSFHGRTLATAAATGQEKVQHGFEPMPEGFYHVDYNDVDAVRAMITDNTVGVLVEAIQGEGGVVPAAEGFLADVRALCDEHNLLMLCDEVQCGMGRTGDWWGFQGAGVLPDAFSTAKGLGSGFPIGAVVAGPKLSDVFQPGKHGSTFGGSPLATAAALATLDVIEEEDLVARARSVGDQFRAELSDMGEKYAHVKEVRGRGLMIGMELDVPAKPFTSRLAEMGVLALPTAEKVVRFLPPLNVKDAEIEEALEIIDEALEMWHEEESGAATADEA